MIATMTLLTKHAVACHSHMFHMYLHSEP